MERIFFDTEEELQAAVIDLRKLGKVAQKLLSEAVERVELKRSRASKAALALENAGFVRVSEPNYWDKSVVIKSTLWGEEALAALEEVDGVIRP